MTQDTHWQVIVVGGGHAGCEAALAAARKGCRTLMLTLKKSTVGVMSCNPAIGGIGKGQLVTEIDALGGMIGQAADYACIQYRLLNRRKGSAVHGPRGQSDRSLYKTFVQKYLHQELRLTIAEGECVDLIMQEKHCIGIMTANAEALYADSVVLTTGTFLRGMIFQGKKRYSAGRKDEKAADALSAKLLGHGLHLGRLKTGTPPRLYRHSIDYSTLQDQPSDEDPHYFSASTDSTQQPQISCHITHTNAQTHDIIRDNLDFSPVYRGDVIANGPRYCPSIEDKIHRFADKQAHQIFLEPEGLDNDLVYPNGISTSLSIQAQEKFLHSINGLQHVQISQFGYTIEYDFIDPKNLAKSLEVKNIPGLFLAGQINGSTGYEEAAAQGLIAGINAANRSIEREPFILARYEAYIGVMIDDMTHKGVSEPYRMFTSRAEYRLRLRTDNALHRLTPLALKEDCLPSPRQKIAKQILDKDETAYRLVHHYKASPHQLAQCGISVNQDGVVRSAAQLLAQQFPFEMLTSVWTELATIDQDTRKRISNALRYHHYSTVQDREIAQLKREEALPLPDAINYQNISSLSHEVRQILQREKPKTLGDAARLQGITPSALVHLMILIQKGKLQKLPISVT